MSLHYKNIHNEQSDDISTTKEYLDVFLSNNCSDDLKKSQKDIDEISKLYFTKNKNKDIDPLKVLKNIEDLEKEIDEFKSEVNYILNDSNS